jgi:glycogen debranching enzyme
MWPTHPDKAWQCFMVVLENQHPSGMVCSPCMETGPNYRFTNPPVHGWVLSRMRRIRELSREQCAQVYLLLVAYSNWWLNARDDDRDGLPCYFHGNDTGWDNSTIFDRTPTVTSPDLATLLALQFDELACLAERLGKPHEAAQHRAQANLLIERMIEKLWTGEAFIALGHDGENCVGDGDCLLLQFPIMLGQRLPRMIREKLIANLSDEERFLCTAGFATESQRSPLFDPSGYWRGPVWPPPMAMLCHGLIDAGAETLARTAASRFITAIARTGYCENHNAKTGDGLCHPFMPWTVAVYRDLQRVIETEGNAVR